MKKKLALLMAAMMTVSLVPVTAFASTKLRAVDEVSTATDEELNLTGVTTKLKSLTTLMYMQHLQTVSLLRLMMIMMMMVIRWILQLKKMV